MKKAFSLEIIILLFAGIGGIVSFAIDKWYFAIPLGAILFGACSYLVGLLKEETLKEFLNAQHDLYEQEKRKWKT